MRLRDRFPDEEFAPLFFEQTADASIGNLVSTLPFNQGGNIFFKITSADELQ